MYWFFSHLGDTYLGRCLAGFDPDGEDIDTLPPHFKEGMENEHIAGAMQLSYGGILKKYPNIESVLLLFLASIVIVYHADTFIRPYVNANSKHPFNDIAILHRPELLNNLRELVTLEPGGSVQQATGVPRYTKILKFIRKIGEENNRGLERVERAIESIPMSVRSAIDDLAVAGGNVTAQMVYDALEQVSQNVKEVVKNEVRTEVIAAMQELRDLLPPPAATPIRAHRPQINMDLGNAGTVYPQYSYVDPHAKGVKKVGRENVYVVPSGFEFSSPSLRNAWIFWFYGKVENQSQKSDGSLYSTPVKPYRFIEPKMLPEKLRKTFNNCWCPILDYMQRAVEADDSVTVPLPTAPSTEFINITYEIAMNVLKSEHPNLFTRSGHSSWTVATWSKELRNSKKRKHGACA